MRDDFSEQTKRVLAARVGHRCSNPNCRVLTAGPQLESGKSLNVGVAAHITAASADGPRYDEALSPEQRVAAENGIWLCQTCAKLIDNDPRRFTVGLLQEWKSQAEDAALKEIGKTAHLTDERFAAQLPEKLRSVRFMPNREGTALRSVLRQCRFYLRVVQLVQDISKLPYHSVTNIARAPEYDDRKRALYARFNGDYTLFMVDLETAMDVLEEVAQSNKSVLAREVVEAIREAATTVAALLDWTEDRRNDPIDLAKLGPTSELSNKAREASKRLGAVAVQRLMELGSA